MKIVTDGKKPPLLTVVGYVCPKCRKPLDKKVPTCFGFDLVCPKGHYRAGVYKG